MRDQFKQWRGKMKIKIMTIHVDDQARALQFYGDLMTKYKVVVPDAITWEFDEIVAGGQNDRYAMTITLAPYGTLINDPKLSKTAGKFAMAWPC